MNIVFMGTPEFAKVSLEKLIESKHNILAVVTKEDKKTGRGQKIVETPVALLAKEKGIKVFKPKSLKDDNIYDEILELSPDILIVVAYGKILPKRYLEIGKFPPINVHGSILPKYRGAAPIQWAVLNGETKTGVTIMYLDEKMDTGDILKITEVSIDKKDTTKTMFEKLSIIGSETLIETLEELEKGKIVPKKQDEKLATYAPLIDKSIQKINWEETADNILNKIRGLNDFLVAKTEINGKTFKIFEAEIVEFENLKEIFKEENELQNLAQIECGKAITKNRRLFIKASDGFLELLVIQPENKKRMNTKDYLVGNSL